MLVAIWDYNYNIWRLEISSIYVEMWLRYWQGNGLAIQKLRVPVQDGQPIVVALGKLITPVCPVTKQYNLVPAKEGDLLGWDNNRRPGRK